MEDKVEKVDPNSVYGLFGNVILFQLLRGSHVLDTRLIDSVRPACCGF